LFVKSRKKNLAVIGASTLVAVFCAAGLARVAEGRGSSEADITRATANLLERSQFSQRPFDDRLSGQFLDRYEDMLDGAHLLFIQSDLDEFGRFLPDLARMTLREGDTQPAHFIYARYLQRLAQEVNFQTNLLHASKFDFTGHDSWQPDRHDAAPPRDLAAAQALWRNEVREDYLREELAGTPAANIVPTLAHRYERLLQTMQHLDDREVLGIYLDALARVYDPHSDYFGREEADNFNIEMNLSLVGIGATLDAKDGYCIISDLVPGGPAARSGLLKPGDRIVAVGQSKGEMVDIMDMPLPRAVELIRGQKGTTVRLTVIPAGSADSTRKTISLVRDKINLADQHAKAAIIDLPQTGAPAMRLGVIDLPSFYGEGDEKAGDAASDTARLIKKLKQAGVRGLILDLRRNGGGSLEEAIRLTGLFIPSGPVVQTRDLQGDVDVGVSPQNDPLYTGPLVVLTSRLSASASEIVAGALQDYGRALIVGDSSTFGKGTVQTILPLAQFFHHRDWGEVKVTIRKFYLPSGASTQLKGVVPDIILPSLTDLPDIAESKLPNALQWDLMPPTTFKKFDLVRPVLAAVREKSRARVAADRGFRLVGEEEAMADKDEEANLLSLNETVRRREKTKLDDLEADLKKTLLAEAARMPPTYELTLANVNSAGLPPARKLERTGRAAVNSAQKEKEANDDLELGETENILVDYIRALAVHGSGVMVAGAQPENGPEKRPGYGD
jgi:carboxyl-terminal processing protease